MASRRRKTTWLAAALLAGWVAPPQARPAEEPRPTPLIESTTSEVVLVEVFARDRKGNPITDLKIDELTLRIDHMQRPEPILSLEWMGQTPGSLPLPGAPPQPTLAESQAPAAPAPEPERSARRGWPRRFLLFFDDATSSPTQMVNARRSAIALLERPGLPNDQFSLASYSQKRRLVILHEFTSDRAALRGVLERSITDNVWRSDYPGDREDRNAEIRRKQAEAAQGGGIGAAALTGEAAQIARAGATEDMQLMSRVLSAMRTLVDALSPWPGYKAVVYVGEGVPENPATDYALNDPRMALTSELGDLAMSAGSANVTLHSVQVEGIAAGGAGVVGAASRRSNALAMLALETGGVTVASNDLTGALDTVERSAEGYYLLSYVPKGPPDGGLHSVDLKVKRGGVQLRYRRSFTRYLPEEARTRAIQAAYVAPELHGDMHLDFVAVRGPVAGNERLFDLVLYLPPGQVLFLPQAGGPAARLDVGVVVIDKGGREALRIARRIVLTPDAARAGKAGSLAVDFFSRVRLPDRAQTLTAVVADTQSGAIGAARIEYAPDGAAATATATGVSLYSRDERSLWIEIDAKPGAKGNEDLPADATVGPALRTRFAPWERVSCGFRAPPPPPGDAIEMRLAVLRGDDVVRTYPVGRGKATGRADPTMHDTDLPIEGLANGDYMLRIEEVRPAGPAEIGRAPFRIEPPAGG